MTTKAYLRQIQTYRHKMQILDQEITELKTAACQIGAVSYDKDRVQSSASGDSTANKVVAYADKEREFADLIDKYITIREKIVSQILELDDDRFRQVLYKRYAEGKKFELIAVEMGYDYIWTLKLHGKALQSFGVKFLGDIE